MRILFVCLGNICRSPMAEVAFLKIVQRENVANQFEIDSAGMQAYHQGELADSRMRYHAAKRGYSFSHRSRPVKISDLDFFDLIIGMDSQNMRALHNLATTEEQKSKLKRMTDYCINKYETEVPDPYYGGDQGFENVIDLLEDACQGLFNEMQKSTK